MPRYCLSIYNLLHKIEHLFLTFPPTKDLMNVLLPNKQMAPLAGSPEKLWAEGSLKRGALGRWELGTIAIIWWAVWLERNRRIFETKKRTARQLLVEIKASRNSWFAHCIT